MSPSNPNSPDAPHIPMTPRTRPRPRSSRSAGVIMIITLIALVLLASLVLWVINIGQQVNNRVTAQHTADAAVKAGAAFLARSMNTIAANNTDLARYVALVSVLDAMPHANAYALEETQAWRSRVSSQIASGGVGGSPAALTHEVNLLLNEMLADMDEQIGQMQTTAQFFAANDVSQLTEYQQGGSLWRAMAAVDALSQSIVESLPRTTQEAANASGESNMPAVENKAVLLLPMNPELPYERGRFADLEWPVRMGMLPQELDDKTIARGPWDTVFGWHEILGYYTGGTWVPGTSHVAGGSSGKDVGISRGATSNGRVVGQEFVPAAYRTYGPFSWLKELVHNFSASELFYTRLSWYEARIADQKLHNVYPNELPPAYTDNSGLHVERRDRWGHNRRFVNSNIREVINPDWRISYDQARSIAQANNPTIRETAFVVIEIKSRYPMGDANFMSPGSWALVEDDGRISPRLVVIGGWEDPARWNVDKTSNWVWRDDWQYQVYFDATIGLTPTYETTTNPDGSSTQVPVPQTVYRVDHFVFLGINVGDEASVSNPYQGFNPDASDAPAPMNLKTAQISYDDPAAHFNHLTLLAVVRRPDTPMNWPSRFRGGRPSPNVMAIAQARVFNNHSWDGWTQMWHSQLAPVSDYDLWAAALQDTVPPGVSQSEVDTLQKYFTATQDLAGSMLAH